ncbi:cytochrome b5-like heme/steroid binding domain-containing protein, partial [Lineolata rhizophorae]
RAASRKVQLPPGRSPLDWAALVRRGGGGGAVDALTGLPGELAARVPLRVSPAQLRAANGRRGAPAWSAYRGVVYNVGAYAEFHPGGVAELMRAAGRDGGRLFEEVHPWVRWEGLLGRCAVGRLV